MKTDTEQSKTSKIQKNHSHYLRPSFQFADNEYETKYNKTMYLEDRRDNLNAYQIEVAKSCFEGSICLHSLST